MKVGVRMVKEKPVNQEKHNCPDIMCMHQSPVTTKNDKFYYVLRRE